MTPQETLIQPQLLDLRDRLKETITHTKDSVHLLRLMGEVDSALQKMDKGTYGICEQCDGDIEEDYLQMDPLAKICFSHLTEEQKRAIEKDLELAFQIQNKLLPEYRNLNVSGWETSYHYEPFGPVSGDFCDLIIPEEENGDLFFIFGDVSGKGISAALLMSHLNAIFRVLAVSDVPLNKLVEQANRLFNKSTLSTHFATLVCGRASASGQIEICNAGHCLPLHAGGGRITSIESTGLPIGIVFSSNYEVKKLQMNKGETMLLYTDGLTETRNDRETEYGDERLAGFFADHHSLPPKELINVLLKDLKEFRHGFPAADDLTIMAITRN